MTPAGRGSPTRSNTRATARSPADAATDRRARS
jgi:hypothetical protein